MGVDSSVILVAGVMVERGETMNDGGIIVDEGGVSGDLVRLIVLVKGVLITLKGVAEPILSGEGEAVRFSLFKNLSDLKVIILCLSWLVLRHLTLLQVAMKFIESCKVQVSRIVNSSSLGRSMSCVVGRSGVGT